MRMTRVLLLMVLLLSGCASTKDPRLRATQERIASEELVLAEFSHGGFDDLLDQATAAGLSAMRPTLEAELGRELTRTENEKLTGAFRTSLAEIYPRELWTDALREVYARHLSYEQMEAILRFYRTPVGQQLLQAQPRIRAEAGAAGERLVATRAEEFQKRFTKEFTGIFGQTGTKSRNAASSALSVAEAIQACRAIHSAADIPIDCNFEYVEGKPAMFVALPNREIAEAYWEAMSEKVAGPFCVAANAASRQALVFVSLVDTQVARMYSCESNQWTDWLPLSKDTSF